MTVSEVLKYDNVIKMIINNDKDINALIKFKMLGMCKQFEPIVKNFETVNHEKILQYGTSDGEGHVIIKPPVKDDYDSDESYNTAVADFEDKFKKFSADIDEVLESEVDITITKFKYSDIMNSGISADNLITIYDLIEE